MKETETTLELGDSPQPENEEEAWQLSIQKWRAIVEAEKQGKHVYNIAGNSCGLCQYFDECESCPVDIVSESDSCDNTPFYDYLYERNLANAQKELDFLLSVGDEFGWNEQEEEPVVDQEILEEMKNSIQNKVDTLKESIAYYLKDLMTAETLENVMETKREILLEFVDKMPLGIHACYFCIKHQDNCDECKYGEVHGKCLDSDSDYHQVEIIRRSLKQALRDHYHTDEDRY